MLDEPGHRKLVNPRHVTALDFALGPEARPRKKVSVILRREIRREQQETGEVDGSFCQHAEQDRKLPSRARRPHPALGLVLGKAQLVVKSSETSPFPSSPLAVPRLRSA
jgi:hypothetical protein